MWFSVGDVAGGTRQALPAKSRDALSADSGQGAAACSSRLRPSQPPSQSARGGSRGLRQQIDEGSKRLFAKSGLLSEDAVGFEAVGPDAQSDECGDCGDSAIAVGECRAAPSQAAGVG